MFEGLVADLLNKYLGKYIQNLDTENLSIGILDGSVELTDLQLKPEALFELNLPIEVKAGYIGKISLIIPWTSLYSLPVVAVVEDVYLLAGPIADRQYDAKREQALQMAIKKQTLEKLEAAATTGEEEPSVEEKGFFTKLTDTIINNVHISVQRIHVRYEDKLSNPDHPFACGVMLKSLSVETTDGKWRPAQIDASAMQINKLLDLQGFSVYWNPYLPENNLVRNKLHTTAWRNVMKSSLDTGRIMEEDFQFMVPPVSPQAKVILNKGDTSTVPKLLASVCLKHITAHVSRQQFLNMVSLADSFQMMSINQRHRKFRPESGVKGHESDWWHYAYTAVAEEQIRPFSWQRIKEHRDRYKKYKNAYKKMLEFPDNKNLDQQLQQLELQMDVANILMAREQARLEFAAEAPDRVKRKKEKQSWWDRLWSGSDDEEEVIVTHPEHTSLLSQLTEEEKEKLYRAIHFNKNENTDYRNQGYVAHKIDMSLETMSFSLLNYSKEVVKLNVGSMTASLENRPDTDSFKFTTKTESYEIQGLSDDNQFVTIVRRLTSKTESFVIEGVSVEHDLVPIITSDIGVYAPSVTQVFSMDFEINPHHVEADLAVRFTVQPVEIIYDEHAVTEVIGFFQVPQVTRDDVMEVVSAAYSRVAEISRAGLQYAIEQHKTLHLSVNMRSPYVVIPEYGTLHRGGNVFIVDFGKLKVESELQPKSVSLNECTLSEIESRLYDKFNITVTDVKMLLADSGEDWHTAQTEPDSNFHILPSVGLQLAFFNSVKADFKDLPQQKLEAKISTLKLHLSDRKLQMLFDFVQHLPFPNSSSMMGLDDSIDGNLEPFLYTLEMRRNSEPNQPDIVPPQSAPTVAAPPVVTVPPRNSREMRPEPDMNALRRIRRAVRTNSAKPDTVDGNPKRTAHRSSLLSIEPDRYYSASDHSDDDMEEWAKPFEIPMSIDDNTSRTNLIQILCRFTLGEVVIQVSKRSERTEIPYLMFRVNRLCMEAAKTTYGIVAQVRLGSLQLVDKIHTGTSGEYLEILSSLSESDLISVEYRKVGLQCPDFDTIYRAVEQRLLVHFSCLKVVFNRAAMLYLNTFIQGLLLGIKSPAEPDLKRSCSTILSEVENEPVPDDMPRSSIVASMFPAKGEAESSVPPSVTKFYLRAELGNLSLRLCNQEQEFADIQIKGFVSRIILKPLYTMVQARMTDMHVEDLTENTLYPKVLTIEDDSVFDVKFVKYSKPTPTFGVHLPKAERVDSSLRVRVGRVHVTVLYMFMSEVKNFLDPFINPETYEAYKVAAQAAVHNTIADVQEQGSRVSLNMDLRAPTLILPQHSQSTNLILIKLGDLSLKNYFEETEVSTNIMQNWDRMFFGLDSMQVLRGKLSLNGNLECAHTIVHPINIQLDVKRALPPLRSDLGYEVNGKVHTLQMQVTQLDLKVVMAVMRENMQETAPPPSRKDDPDYNPLLDHMATADGTDQVTTPVVEMEQPLLEAPEVSELARQTQFDFVLDGMVLLLLDEEEEDSLLSESGGSEDMEGICRLEMGRIDVAAMLSENANLTVKISLLSVVMEDIRQHSNLAIKRVIQSSGTSSSKISIPRLDPMVSLEYKKDQDGNQHINMCAETVRVNVCVPYLLLVTNFFLDSLRESEHSIAIPETPQRIDNNNMSPVRPSTPADTSYTLTISGRFRQPEIVLFAEPTNKNSRVLVLKTNLSFHYYRHQEREHMDAKVKQLEIVSCLYGRNLETAAVVLRPCDIELQKTSESTTSPVVMDMKISDIFLYMSSSTLHVCLDVLDIIRSDLNTVPAASDLPSYPTMHHDLWTTNAISTEPWLEPLPDETDITYPITPSAPPSEKLHLEMKKVQVMFEVENLDFHVPRLCVKLAVNGDIHDWSTTLRSECQLELEMCYFNDVLATWEPLLEPVREAEGCYRPWHLMAKLVRASSHPMTSTYTENHVDKEDDIDGDVHYLMSWSRQHSDSSQTDSDSDTEMTIIKPKLNRKTRHMTDKSYECISGPGNVQGESDSEPEPYISSLHSKLDLLSSDSSDIDVSDAEDDIHHDKPVFLTAKGPIHVESDIGPDEPDGPRDDGPLCTYIAINSFDMMNINLTPKGMDVMMEVIETLTGSPSSILPSIRDLPGFEAFNKLDVKVRLCVSKEIGSKIYEENLHDVDLGDGHDKLVHMAVARSRSDDAMTVTQHDGDEVDGLAYLNTGGAGTASGLIEPAHLILDAAAEDEENHNPTSGQQNDPAMVSIEVEGFDAADDLTIRKAANKLVALTPTKNGTDYCLIYALDVCHGRKVLTLRSPLQVTNQLGIAMRVCCRTSDLIGCGLMTEEQAGKEYSEMKLLEPAQTWDVPLYVAYHCQLFFVPAIEGYNLTRSGFWWQDLSGSRENMRPFYCDPVQPDDKIYHFKVVWEEGTAKLPLCGMPKKVPHYSLKLKPALVLHNWLPYDLQFMFEGNTVISLPQGESTPVYTAALSKVQIQVFDYLGLDWKGSVEISSSPDEYKAISMETELGCDAGTHQLSLIIHIKQSDTMRLYVYSPYWIVNHTGLPIQIRGSRSDVVYENGASPDPILFRFKKYRRKKAKIRVHNSKWSHSFSLDTVGNSGVVFCKDRERNRKYQLLVQISLSSLKLMKIVSILPQFVVANNTNQQLRYMEENETADLWLNIDPQQTSPFWPNTDSMHMFVRYETSTHCSIHFQINENHRTVLRMDNGSALVVEVTGGTDAPFTIAFSQYEHGDAPVKVLNLCEDVFIKLHQKNHSHVSLLSPNHSVLYTWDDPTAERTLMWNVYNRKKPSYPAFIAKDGSGEEPISIQTVRRSSFLLSMGGSQDRGDGGATNAVLSPESSEDDETEEEAEPAPPKEKEKLPLLSVVTGTPDANKVLTTRTDKVLVYWVSYMEGLQRVLLLTQDPRIAKRANKEIEVEQTQMEVFMSLNGVGLSLINSMQEEIAYISLSCAPSMWEVEVKGKWKLLNMERASWLEEKWQQREETVAMESFLQADLRTMEMTKPFIGSLRRRYSPAIWLQYQQSQTQFYVQTKFHRLQADNQLSDAYFPTVLYPTPAPSYVAARNGTRPFVEMAVILKRIPNTNSLTVKFCKVLVQELNIQLDKGFLLTLYDFASSRWAETPQEVQLKEDIAYSKKSVQELITVQAASRSQKIVFEYLHLSPLKLHVSFSLEGKSHLSNPSEDSSLSDDLVEFFLSSVGATLTEIKEVELKMAYFEKQGVLLSPSQLMSAVQSHYTSQAIQQAYVLILGLDVLGNPYGLIKDFTQGLGDLFYEPIMGSIHGPDSFMQNLVQGIHSLMGHTVGGLASSASLITGSLGKALATLSFDEDYKRQRRRHMNQQPKHLPKSLYLAGQSFVMGVVLGISGIIVSPIKGANEEGVEGFFKGIGKGLMGIVTKPAGGAIDMVSMAFDGLRRAAEMGDEVVMRQRLPRFIDAKKGVKPYSPYQSAGMRLLNIIGKGRYSSTDTYVAHAALTHDEHPSVAMVSDKHIFLLEKSRCWSQWDIMWTVDLSDIFAPPVVRGNTLVFRVRRDEGRERVFTGDEHVIHCDDEEVLVWLQGKIEGAMAAQVQGH